MKKLLVSLLLAATAILPATASAQSLSARVEGGAAVPLTEPQSKRFDVGGAVALKPELGVGSYFGLGPSVQFMGLPSNISGVNAGTAWSYGGFVRVKRPHDEKNTGSGFSAVSPWLDTDLKYVRTDGLDRLGWSAGVGAHVPTSDERSFWIGPFARYDVVHQADGKPNMNTSSAKTLIFGLSLEFGAAQKTEQQEPSQPPVEEVKNLPVEEKKEEPSEPPVKEVVVVEFKPRVQFAWDSAELRPSENENLSNVVRALLADTSYKVRVEGHASSEGTVEHNEKLARQRAQAVVDYLVSNGVSRDRLTAVGFGSRVPVADNTTEAGRVVNRRVEFDCSFVLLKGDK